MRDALEESQSTYGEWHGLAGGQRGEDESSRTVVRAKALRA